MHDGVCLTRSLCVPCMHRLHFRHFLCPAWVHSGWRSWTPELTDMQLAKFGGALGGHILNLNNKQVGTLQWQPTLCDAYSLSLSLFRSRSFVLALSLSSWLLFPCLFSPSHSVTYSLIH